MRSLIIFYILGFLLSFGTSEAVTPARKPYHRTYHKKPAVKKPQQHYSFVPPYQPSPTMLKLQQPLQGRVVQKQLVPETPAETKPQPEQPPAAIVTPVLPVKPQPSTQRYRQSILSRVLSKSTGWMHRPPSEIITSAHSWVDGLTPAESSQFSALVADAIQQQCPDKHIPILLSALPKKQAINTFLPNLAYALQQKGYTLAQPEQIPSHQVRYRISSLPDGLLLRIKIDDLESSRLYQRSYSGALMAASPLTTIKRKN